MALSEILPILVDAFQDVVPLPNFADKSAVRPWACELAGDAVDVIYALGGPEQAAIKLQVALDELQATGSEHAANVYMAARPEKDRPFIDWLKTVDWAKVIQTIITIISVIPK